MILPLLAVACLVQSQASSAEPATRPTLHYLPHTHWEGAVFFTREEYLERGLTHLLTAVHLLETQPDYQFTLDQVAYVKPFLERYPEAEASFRKFVAEKRLHIVGGMDVMPDDVKPGGELFVRQMQYGKKWCSEALGVDVRVAWLLDTFGHHPQMPQLLARAGFDSFWFCRGVPDDSLPSEFMWRGIDGTTIPAFWIPGFYGLFFGPPRDDAGFAQFFEERWRSLDGHARGAERVGLAGVDVCRPEEDVAPLVRKFNERADAPFTIRFSGPEEFAALVAKRADVPVLDGDFNPIFQGTYSSRIELHQATREIEQELLTAEKLAAIGGWLGAPASAADFERAWEPLLFNQTHDLASGVMTDVVYADTLASYGFSHRLAEQLRDDSFDRVASLVDTRGEGVPVIVFNPLAWPRTEVVEVDVGFVAPDVHGFHVVAPDGATIAAQIVASESHQDGALRSVRVAFLARDLPALGWATFRIVGTARPGGASTAESLVLGGGDSEGAAVVGSLENESFKVVVDGTGAIRSLFDKARNEEWLSAPANVVARSPDDGDLWEIGHRLDGGMFVAATTKQPVPDGKSGLLSSQESGKATWIRGPVFSELRVAHPFGSGSFTTRLRVAAGVARVDVETELVNQEKRVRYQALFPTKVRDGRCVQSIPFGAVERPLGVEYPAQDWVDLGDETRGMTLLNVGLAGNVATDGTLMLSLLRSEDLRGYDEGRSSESGFELGVPRTFRYALVPHAGTWREAASFRRGLEWNAPLVVRKTTTHAGELPARFRFVEVADANVVLTSARPGSDGTLVLRLYEACGRATRAATIRFAAKVTSACDADLLERPGTPLTPDGDALRVDFHPFEIKTLRVQLAR